MQSIRRWLMAGAAGLSSLVLGVSTASQALATPTYAFEEALAIPGTTSTNKFTGYDLATVNDGIYYLTDRSFNRILTLSTATNTFLTPIGTGLFAGTQGGNNNIAGPNGISVTNVSGGKLLLAGNGPSNLLAFNLANDGLTVQGTPRTISTAVAGTPSPQNRVDGVAYAPAANTILAANNAANPGFLTLLKNDTTGTVIKSIILNGMNGYPNVADNGVEATIYNTERNSFFVAVPSLDPDPVKSAGGVIEIDATTGALLNTYDFSAMGLSGPCSPTGMAQGNGASVFVACSDGTAGHSIILDPTGTGTLTLVAGISGGDQASFNPTTNTFFEAARFQTGGPVLGIVDAATDLLTQTLPIGGNDHSVAVDPITNQVYVATAPTNAYPGCTVGCILVFQAVPEPASLAMLLTPTIILAGFAAARRRG